MKANRIRLLCSDASHLPIHLTLRDSRIAEKYGFQYELDAVGVSRDGKPARRIPERATCLLAGEYEFLSGLHHEPFAARLKGDKRFVYLAQTQNYWDDRLIARPEIKTAKQLEGKRVLTSNVSCVFGNLSRAISQSGVDIGKIDFVFMKGLQSEVNPANVERLVQGEFDAVSVDIPFDLRAQQQGMNVISLPDIPVVHNTTITANLEFVSKNEDVVVTFLKALIEAIHFFKNEPQKVCEILDRELAPILGLKGESEIEHLQREWSQLLLRKPFPHPLALWNVFEFDLVKDQQLSSVNPLEVWDTHYLRQIDGSGFIDSLYQQEG